MDLLRCTRCGTTTDPVRAHPGAAAGHPDGWATVSISGRPVTNVLLCPPCVFDVRGVIAALPASDATIEPA